MNIAPHRGEYREVICLKTKSIISVDYGNIEIFEGKTYRRSEEHTSELQSR